MKIFLAVVAFIVSSFNFLVKQVSPGAPPMPTPIASPEPTAEVGTSTPRMFTRPPKPTPPASITPTTAPSTNINNYIYPGSQIISSSATNLSLKSSNNPDSIINWYQAKVNSGFSSRSDSITNTNGNVSGNISAGNNSQNINITIKKGAGELYTTVEIEIKSY
jgi:hypothetical protein